MSALIDNGQSWMKPLLDFRNLLQNERNIHEHRMPKRKNGQDAVSEDGRNFGPYWDWYRAKKLRQLLEIQKEVQKDKPNINLITNQELIAIQVIWNREMIFDFNVGDIYKNVFNKEISTNNIKSLDDTERRILKEVCTDDISYYHLIDNLLTLQETKTLMISKYGLHNDVENRIETFVNEISNENR